MSAKICRFGSTIHNRKYVCSNVSYSHPVAMTLWRKKQLKMGNKKRGSFLPICSEALAYLNHNRKAHVEQRHKAYVRIWAFLTTFPWLMKLLDFRTRNKQKTLKLHKYRTLWQQYEWMGYGIPHSQKRLQKYKKFWKCAFFSLFFAFFLNLLYYVYFSPRLRTGLTSLALAGRLNVLRLFFAPHSSEKFRFFPSGSSPPPKTCFLTNL